MHACTRVGTTLFLATVVFSATALADKKYGPGVTDSEIRLGQTMPYSGPLSGYGTLGRVEAAYFRTLNDRGGINGRKINFISLDDGFQPPKTVEATRRLVEQDEALLLCGNDLPRENVMRQVANLHDLQLPLLRPGIRINTSPTDFYPVQQLQMMRFDGKQWQELGEVISE